MQGSVGGLFLLYTHKIRKSRGNTRGQKLLIFFAKAKNISMHVSLTATDWIFLNRRRYTDMLGWRISRVSQIFGSFEMRLQFPKGDFKKRGTVPRFVKTKI